MQWQHWKPLRSLSSCFASLGCWPPGDGSWNRAVVRAGRYPWRSLCPTPLLPPSFGCTSGSQQLSLVLMVQLGHASSWAAVWGLSGRRVEAEAGSSFPQALLVLLQHAPSGRAVLLPWHGWLSVRSACEEFLGSKAWCGLRVTAWLWQSLFYAVTGFWGLRSISSNSWAENQSVRSLHQVQKGMDAPVLPVEEKQ